MPYGLTIGTERAAALQNSIQDELMRRGYSTDADPVMAEYITIMIINNKSSDNITSELEDLIGSDFDPTFTDWLFTEAAKGAEEPPAQPSTKDTQASSSAPVPKELSHAAEPSRRNSAPRTGVFNQALSQALPSGQQGGQKRSASARSPSPNHPNKVRRTDVPTGPRAMSREGPSHHSNSRSLLDRVGGPAPFGHGRNGMPNEIQAQLDNMGVTPDQAAMMMAAANSGFPGMNGMDMNGMSGMASNPMMLQEMMLNQMAMMAHMASSMGILNPTTGQMNGLPMQAGVDNYQMNGMNNGMGRGRGGGRGVRGGRGRGGGGQFHTNATTESSDSQSILQPSIPAPSPAPPVASIPAAPTTTPVTPNYAVPERPQSPTLCKFGLKCNHANCRYSHPSPVATAESGVVLSNDPCEQGKGCKDKDCIKAHVSPAVLNPEAVAKSAPSPSTPQPTQNQAPCRFGTACTKPNCPFSHPPRPSTISCKFGAACTRATCQYKHPEGRVLPSAFHRGLSTSSPMVTVHSPEAGSMGGPSPHKSVQFNKGGPIDVKERLEKQMKELEEKKNQLKEAQAAAANKPETPIAA